MQAAIRTPLKDAGVPESCLPKSLSKRLALVYTVLHQRACVRRNDDVRPLYLPAKILERCNVSNLVIALESIMPQISTTESAAISEKIFRTYVGLMGDAVGYNRLAQAALAHRVPSACIADDV